MRTPRDPEGLCTPDVELADGSWYAGASVELTEAEFQRRSVALATYSATDELVGQRLLELDRKVRNFNTKVVRATLEGATAKVGHEAVEFLSHPDKEAKDVLITLLGWVGVSGHDVLWLIEQAIAKMEINEGRRWVQQPDGSWQHTEDGTS